jgi:UDP-glucose:(heptosyl)LPS alpha-1,3-glucosyltransferase
MSAHSDTLKVGILIDRWEPERGGAERALDDLARWLTERRFDVHVFAREAILPPPGTFHAVKSGRWRLETRGTAERRLGEALVLAAESERCDVTIGVRHVPRADLYWPHGGSHWAALHGVRCARARSLLDPAEVRPTGRHRVFLDLEREVVADGGARRVACVSQLVQAEFAQLYPGATDRLRLVPNGVDTERFHPRERAQAGARLRAELEIDERTPLLTLGARNAVLKGLPALIDALVPLQSRPWRLLVAGPRERGPWMSHARDAGLDVSRITIASDVDPVALASAADLCVLPSWRDSCGLVVLEALSSGTPVVTTRLCGAAEAIGSESVGRVIDHPGDVAALGEAIAHGLDRVDGDSIDRSVIREAVRGRERDAWLGSLERLVRELAAR